MIKNVQNQFGSDLTRRQVTTAAAWSVPVILLAVTTPAAAASAAATGPIIDLTWNSNEINKNTAAVLTFVPLSGYKSGAISTFVIQPTDEMTIQIMFVQPSSWKATISESGVVTVVGTFTPNQANNLALYVSGQPEGSVTATSSTEDSEETSSAVLRYVGTND